MRIAALPGEPPYFVKDIWRPANGRVRRSSSRSDIAKVFDAKLEYVESTYAGSVLDLQSNKIDLAFALNPTPQRALVIIGFTQARTSSTPMAAWPRRGSSRRPGPSINKPDIKHRLRPRVVA